jgi:putative tryptophan/tyrosine transport system substrate-binding protein
MRRREFLGLIGGGLAWPVAGQAQQGSMPLIGFLSSRAPKESAPHVTGFLRGLEAFGIVDGKTAKIDDRWANGQYDRLRNLAAELAQLKPAMIVAAGGAPSARAAKSINTSIPIVFVASDPISEGVIASLNQPGANITGIDLMSGELTGKRLGLLAQLVPAGGVIGFLTNTRGVQSSLRVSDFRLAAAGIGRETLIVGASTDAEIDEAFSTVVQKRVGGLVVENDPYFDSQRERLVRLAAQRSIPAIYHIREFPVAGGLMSYGANLVEAYYQMGVLVGRVLKGATIADLPVARPTKFELAINLGVARKLGLTVPPAVLAIADELVD